MKKKQTIKVLVDVTTDFVTGPFGSEAALEKVPAMVDFLTIQDSESEALLVTVENHGAIYENCHENLKFPVPHGIQGTPGAELFQPVRERFTDMSSTYPDNCFLIEKDRFMAYEQMESIKKTLKDKWLHSVEEEKNTKFIFAGLVTNICVIANALLFQAAFPWAAITVDASLCVGVTSEIHKKALDVMESMTIRVINR